MSQLDQYLARLEDRVTRLEGGADVAPCHLA